MFRKTAKKSMTGVDKIVTWLIIGWAIASIFWASQTKSWKKVSSSFFSWIKKSLWFSYSIFWKWLVKVITLFKRKKELWKK